MFARDRLAAYARNWARPSSRDFPQCGVDIDTLVKVPGLAPATGVERGNAGATPCPSQQHDRRALRH